MSTTKEKAGPVFIHINGQIVEFDSMAEAAIYKAAPEMAEALEHIKLDLSHPNDFPSGSEMLKCVRERAEAALRKAGRLA